MAGDVPLWKKADRWLARRLVRRMLPLGAGPGVVTVSFDDAPVSACREGRAILDHHGVKGTWYVAGGLTDRLEQGEACHSVQDLEALLAHGHELGCHTFDHQPCSALGAEQMRSQLQQNRRFLQGLAGGAAPQHFSFPLGDYGLASKRLAAGCFDSVRLTRAGIHRGSADLNGLLAQRLYADEMTADRLRGLIAEAAACSGWLILYTHGVSAQPRRWGCTPALLEQVLTDARAHGCKLLAVGQALAHFRARTEPAP